MRYIISSAEKKEKNTVVLQPDTWDDFGFKTTFYATYYDEQGNSYNLGCIKIGRLGLSDEFPYYSTASELRYPFNNLSRNFCSLWQSAEDYKNVYDLLYDKNINIFEDLRDLAYDLDSLDENCNDDVVRLSLMRGISKHTIENQFHRIILGAELLKPYSFKYRIYNSSDRTEDLILSFDATPQSLPPTNVHCIIGPNGAGKTSIIKSMIESIIVGENNKGCFEYDEEKETGYFESVVCVSFSPFDDFETLGSICNSHSNDKRFSYIGVKKTYSDNNNNPRNLLQDINDEFIKSLVECYASKKKREDLALVFGIFIKRGINPIGIDIEQFKEKSLKQNELEVSAREAFGQLSAGHKSVLSILTRCVDKVSEKTVLFLDEPENHLHPPLLSDLIRCISELMSKRNGVAILSTHSPIVLQEVPSTCVWHLIRRNAFLIANRIEIESFGANVGILTHRVFGHELGNSGFVALLKKEVDNNLDYDAIVEKFHGNLGEDAKSVLRVLISNKEENI